MTPFTDDDLKRLKDACANEKWGGSMQALLARLEAAEQCCESAIRYEHVQDELWQKLLNEDYSKWRKAAGRG